MEREIVEFNNLMRRDPNVAGQYIPVRAVRNIPAVQVVESSEKGRRSGNNLRLMLKG